MSIISQEPPEMDPWDENIVTPAQEVDERGIVELVHDGYLGPGYRTMHEAWAMVGKPGHRSIVKGENGKWYCLARVNARRYKLACDLKRRAKE